MKNFRLRFVVFVVLLLCLSLTACDLFADNGTSYSPKNQRTPLDTPIVVIDDDGLATWSAIENAVSYQFVIDDNSPIITDKLSVELSDGERIKVKANGDKISFIDSDFSQETQYISSNKTDNNGNDDKDDNTGNNNKGDNTDNNNNDNNNNDNNNTGNNDNTGNNNANNNNDNNDDDNFENYGKEVKTVYLSKVNVNENGIYTSMAEVGAYLYLYHKLPSNFVKKSEFDRSDYTSSNKLSVGGDVFYNKEQFLPIKSGRTYYECDIDYTGGSRNAKRIVFSSDNLIFYTDTHYDSFYILRFI